MAFDFTSAVKEQSDVVARRLDKLRTNPQLWASITTNKETFDKVVRVAKMNEWEEPGTVSIGLRALKGALGHGISGAAMLAVGSTLVKLIGHAMGKGNFAGTSEPYAQGRDVTQVLTDNAINSAIYGGALGTGLGMFTGWSGVKNAIAEERILFLMMNPDQMQQLPQQLGNGDALTMENTNAIIPPQGLPRLPAQQTIRS